MKIILRIIVLILLSCIAQNLSDMHIDGMNLYFLGIGGGILVYHFFICTIMDSLNIHVEKIDVEKIKQYSKDDNDDNDDK